MRPNLNWRRAKTSKNLGLQVKSATTVHVIQFQITGQVTHFNKRVQNIAKPMLHIKLCFQQNKNAISSVWVTLCFELCEILGYDLLWIYCRRLYASSCIYYTDDAPLVIMGQTVVSSSPDTVLARAAERKDDVLWTTFMHQDVFTILKMLL